MQSYMFENKIIEDCIHLMILKSCFKAILALLLSLKALFITEVVKEYSIYSKLTYILQEEILAVATEEYRLEFFMHIATKTSHYSHFTEYGVEYFGRENILRKRLNIYLKE